MSLQELQRLNYHDGMFLVADLCTLEQNYFTNSLCYQMVSLYTSGTLSGLQVQSQGKTITLSPGVALDPQGRLLVWPDNAGPISVPQQAAGDYAIYLVFPELNVDKSSSAPDIVTELPVVKFVAANAVPASQTTMVVALATLDDQGRITQISIQQTPVKSRVQAATDNQGSAHAKVRLGQTMLASPQNAKKSANTKKSVLSQTISYLKDGTEAFTSPPLLQTTVCAKTGVYAVTVTDINTRQFSVNVMRLDQALDSEQTVQLQWLAHPAV
jgi:hypothetical protein